MVLLLASCVVQAQADGAALAKQARKNLTAYSSNPVDYKNKLTEAIQTINQAMQTTEAQALASAWLTKGDIYNYRLESDLTAQILNPTAPYTGDNDALVAFEAYQKAYTKAEKIYEKSDALKGIQSVQGSLINIGVVKYEIQNFEKAYLSFNASLQAHHMLAAAQVPSVFDDPSTLHKQMYITAVSASLAKRYNDAIPYLETLVGLDSAQAYEPLYQSKLALGDEAGAEKVLAEGRRKFPQDAGLLFAEINSYLQKGKLQELTDPLKQAIQQEPANVGLYVTLGNVYDNLYQAMSRDKNEAKASEYFNEAKKYYQQATAMDSNNVDAVYSLGALYYNQAAIRTQEMNALPEDFSAAGLQKLAALRDAAMALFEQALPYFQKAESLNPNDLNTLLALHEIYMRKEEEGLSQEFKKRLEVVKGGGANARYFK